MSAVQCKIETNAVAVKLMSCVLVDKKYVGKTETILYLLPCVHSVEERLSKYYAIKTVIPKLKFFCWSWIQGETPISGIMRSNRIYPSPERLGYKCTASVIVEIVQIFENQHSQNYQGLNFDL